MAQQSLLFSILRATHASGTHHKLALDALAHLRSPDAELWRRMFLNEATSYLEGSKAPDKEFKDFTNHVLHVRDGYWGGAAEKTTSWYGHTVDALRAQNWRDAAYAAGVMSHYYTDPIMPFHTAQSEAENNIHRAAEWSISNSYDELNRLARSEFPVPDVLIENRDDWVADLVCDAAEISNTFYEKMIANYDLDRGVVDPVTGLNERARRIVAQLITYAQVGQARILDRALVEAGVQPPEVSLTAETVLSTLKIPLKWVLRKMDDAADRATVTAMYDELQSTGTVEKTLPADDRAVRNAFRRDVGEATVSSRPMFRPPHTGGAFDYSSALKDRVESVPSDVSGSPAVDAEAKVEAQAKKQSAKAKRKAEKVAAQTPAVVATEPEVEVDEPAKVDDATDEAANRTPVATSVATAAEVNKATEQSADTSNAKPASKAPFVLPRMGRDSEPSAPEELTNISSQETTEDVGFDAAAMLRDRVAEMQAADTSSDARSSTPDFRLHREDEVEDGPSVGPKTAIRLNKVGIVTVQDLLDADPQDTADAVDVSYIRAKTIIDWQDQARLQCDVPGLAGTASQLVVGSGVRSAAELAAQDADALTEAVAEFADSSEGHRLLRDRAAPGRSQVAKWIANAAFASTSKAA